MRVQETNDISQNFSGMTLCYREVSKYFIDFQLVLSKDDSKVLVSFIQIRNFEVSNLGMAKVQKVNIAVT